MNWLKLAEGVIAVGLAGYAIYKLAKDWNEIVNWLKNDMLPKFKERYTNLRQKGFTGTAKLFAYRVREGNVRIRFSLFHKEQGKLIEEMDIREVPEIKLPSYIQKIFEETKRREVSRNEIPSYILKTLDLESKELEEIEFVSQKEGTSVADITDVFEKNEELSLSVA